MENLIDLTDDLSQLHQPLSVEEFGMIQRECIVTEVIGHNNSKAETLKPGTLIQIRPDRIEDECHFKLWELSNWLDKYKTTTYKCSKEDYVMVTKELLSYLLTINRGGDRVKFMQNIANRQFDVELLRSGCEVRIQGFPGSKVDYYEFVVTYNGVMEENGPGYYIGLQLKNGDLPKELSYLSQNYRFGGMGIVVPADWIMVNLYKKPVHHEKTSSVAVEMTEDLIENIQQQLSTQDATFTEITKNTVENVQTAKALGKITRENLTIKLHDSSSELDMDMLKVGREIRIRGPRNADVSYYDFVVINNGIVKEKSIGYYVALELKNKRVLLPNDLIYLPENYRSGNKKIVVPVNWIFSNLYKEEDCPTVTPTTIAQKNIFPVDHVDLYMVIKNVPQSIIRTPSLSVEPNNISEAGARAEQNYRSSEFVPELISSAKSISMMTETQNNFESIQTSSIPNKNFNISETGTIPKSHNVNQTNYVTEIEMINNADGSVRNAEITICDLCKDTVEIGSGVILRECLHSFCLQCIRHHVKHSTNNSTIQCPYIGEYECKSDLWDIEIKDLAGDLDYNRILENRLNEFMVREPNSRKCLNENCKHIWYSSTNTNSFYEKCPKCKKSWHKSPLEQNEKYRYSTGKSIIKEVSKLVEIWNKKTPMSQSDSICDQCLKSIIFKTETIPLQNCKHLFCKNCIVTSIEMQTSGSLYATCTICKERLDDNEVTMISGLKVLKLFLNNRAQQKQVDKATTPFCNCLSPSSNCDVVLKCNHKVCRTFLFNTLPHNCPNCYKKIDKFLLQQLVDEMSTNTIKKCETCIKPANASLKKCGHLFCNQCISDLIQNQMSDPSKLNINCIVCHNSIIESDILLYGGEALLVQFKSKIKAVKVDPKPSKNVTLNDSPHCCVSCKKKLSFKFCIVLSGCRHIFCQTCFNENIGHQLSSSQILNCPLCKQELAQFQVDAILKKSVNGSNDFIKLVECLACKTKTMKRLIHQCLKCTSSLCLKCAYTTIVRQIAQNRAPFCSICKILLDESQIVSIKKHTFTTEKLEKFINQNQLEASEYSTTTQQNFKTNQTQKPNTENYNIPDTCFKCSDRIQQRFNLRYCGHVFCYYCIEKHVTEQQTKGLDATCPKCHRTIKSDEIIEIKKFSHNLHVDLTQTTYETHLPRHDSEIPRRHDTSF